MLSNRAILGNKNTNIRHTLKDTATAKRRGGTSEFRTLGIPLSIQQIFNSLSGQYLWLYERVQ